MSRDPKDDRTQKSQIRIQGLAKQAALGCVLSGTLSLVQLRTSEPFDHEPCGTQSSTFQPFGTAFDLLTSWTHGSRSLAMAGLQSVSLSPCGKSRFQRWEQTAGRLIGEPRNLYLQNWDLAVRHYKDTPTLE